MMRLVLTAVLAAAVGFAGGHFLWPARPSAQQLAGQSSSRFTPATATDEAAPEDKPPEIWSLERAKQAIRELADIKSLSKRSEAANELIAHLDPADVADLAAFVAAGAHDAATRQLLSTLLLIWTESDAEAAVRFCTQLGDVSAKTSCFGTTFTTWAQEDLEGARSFAAKLEAGPLRKEVDGMLMDAAANVDPKEALKLAQSHGGSVSLAETRSIFAQWAMHDLDGALDEVKRMPDGRARAQALDSVMNSWASEDPEAALKWVTNQDDQHGLTEVLKTAFQTAASERPDLAAAYAQSLGDGQTRDQIINTLGVRWASVDLAAAKSWATGMRDRDRDMALEGLVSGVAYDDPKAALDLAAAITDSRQRQSSLSTVLSSWADREPEAALAYARTLEDGGAKDEILSNVIGTWGRINPIAAAEAITEIAEGQEHAVGEISHAWAEADPQSASRWVERLPTGDGKRVAMSMLMNTWADSDPVAASAWAERHGDDEAVMQLGLSWASRDPQAASEWALQRSGVGERAFDHVMSSWASSDPRRAAAWASALPRGANRDRAFMQLSEANSYEDAQTSMAYVEEITDVAERNRTRTRIFDIWKARSPKDAERWRSTARLSPSEMATLDTGEPEPEPTPDEQPQGCVCPPL